MQITNVNFALGGMNVQLFDPTPPPPSVIGQSYGGGYYAGVVSTTANGTANYRLVVSPKASGSATRQFKTTKTNDPGATSVIDGPTNTANMNDASHPAAQFCTGLTIGGYTDWYLPSKKEYEILFYNLKPSTYSNTPNGDSDNPYSVPSRAGANYLSGTPAQTSATDFRDTGTEYFATFVYYLTGTQYNANYAWGKSFTNGTQVTMYKNVGYKIRAIRRVAI
jgi:hypothetical protein